jgi:hypothetical protein
VCKSIAWWPINEGQFTKVGVLAQQILGILRFQIEMKKVFTFVNVVATLSHCHLEVENLDYHSGN